MYKRRKLDVILYFWFFFKQSMFAYASYQTSGMVKEVNVVSIQDDDETDGDDIDPGFGE